MKVGSTLNKLSLKFKKNPFNQYKIVATATNLCKKNCGNVKKLLLIKIFLYLFVNTVYSEIGAVLQGTYNI